MTMPPCRSKQRWRTVPHDWRCNAIDFEIVEIAFDQLDPARAARLSNIATRFRLPPEEVDLLVDSGHDAVLANPALRRLLARGN